MKTILIPLDGSALAEQALPYVRMLAPLLRAKVTLMRVVTEEEQRAFLLGHAADLGIVPLPGASRQYEQHLIEELLRHAEAYLSDQAEPLRAAGLSVGFTVASGAAPECIAEEARRDSGTLIVMATHGYSGVRRWALGSVADRLVHTTTAPVLLVRSGVTAPERLALRHILVPLDGSAFSEQALPVATELAACAGAELDLLQVVLPPAGLVAALASFAQPVAISPELITQERDAAMEHLQHRAGELARPEITVSPNVEVGYPAEIILDEAVRRRADLIVMATHGRSGLQRWTLGSVADKVLHASTTPLLLIRAQSA